MEPISECYRVRFGGRIYHRHYDTNGAPGQRIKWVDVTIGAHPRRITHPDEIAVLEQAWGKLYILAMTA